MICIVYGPADATATPSSLGPVKPRMVYLSGAGLHRLSWKRPLKGCSSSSSSSKAVRKADEKHWLRLARGRTRKRNGNVRTSSAHTQTHSTLNAN